MRRKVLNIMQYDYTSKEEFEKHKEEMRSKGWSLTDNTGFGETLKSGEVIGSEKWFFTAYYYKDLIK